MARTSTSFKKGQVANPRGRPVGAVSEYRKKFNEMGKLASNDAKDVYEELRQHMKSGEAWAYQLYVKDLIPKKAFQDIAQINQEEGQSRVEAVTSALNQFKELTHDELIDEIRVFKEIEEVKKEENGTSVLDLLDGQKLKLLHGWIEEAKAKK